MFDYVVNEFNPDPRLVLDPAPLTAHRVRHLPFSTASVVDLPPDLTALHQRQPGRYWAELRRRERRFEEAHGPLVRRTITDPDELRPALCAVQALYRERWHGEYTSLPWKDPNGFAPYADALVELARQGRGLLQVLEGADRLLAFGYCLLERPWAHLYQHAATPDEALRRYGVGKLLLADLLRRLVEDRFEHLDLMLGDAAYKREWESWRRPVYLRLVEPDTLSGRCRLAARGRLHEARIHNQFHRPRLRRLLKRTLGTLDALPGRGRS